MESSAVIRSEGERGGTIRVADDVACLRQALVNVFLVGAEGARDREWVLVDTGIPGIVSRIVDAAAERFGRHSRPAAIVLTHGHFDHVGGLPALADRWSCPVYAHELEMPYLTGRSAYPPPDPSVGGGSMALLSPLYPKGPIDLGTRVRALPADGALPGMPGWTWIHTPGHAPGHVSLWRLADRVLLSGDAVITTKQESALAVATQRAEIHGPPMYFTPNWDEAHESALRLAALEPEVLASGHGRPMRGAEMRAALHRLARDFDELARPAHGRYRDRPAVIDASGVVSLPPRTPASVLPQVVLGLGAGIALGAVVRWAVKGRVVRRESWVDAV